MTRNNGGFTLIEQLMVLVLSSLLLAVLYKTALTQQKAYSVQEQVVDTQQNGRMAIDRMDREIRMAGYRKDILDFLGNISGYTKVLTPVNGANHVGKNDDQITLIVEDKAITFRLQWDGTHPTMPVLVREENGVGEVLAEDIENLQFEYILKDGTFTETPGNTDDVRTVRTTIIARTKLTDPDLKGVDGYRRRELSSVIKVRNLGL